MDPDIQWPQKTREMQTFCLDSTYWNGFEFRDDDIIIIATWAKAGTTWVQQIVANLIFEGETEGMPVGDMSPWLDFRLPPLEVKLPGIIAQWCRGVRQPRHHWPLEGYAHARRCRDVRATCR